jgi:HAD superfamily hydrolase (TIGR01549 family)
LFDLDGTLLDIELESFLHAYFAALGPVLATVTGPEVSQREALAAVLSGTQAMSDTHPTRTNREVFTERFCQLTGGDLDEPGAIAAIERFYAQKFPELRGSHGPRAGGAAAVLTARASGLATVLATNPIFPLSAIRERMRWAELDASWFEFITSYETSTACKPNSAYYLQIAERLGIDPTACLMVGDDAALDMPAADIGMKTFYVGADPAARADWYGDLSELQFLLLSVAPKG